MRSDEESGNHLPKGDSLAVTEFVRVPGSAETRISWSSPATLTAGHVHHVVFTNVDPNPRVNHASLDGIWLEAQPVSADPQ